jgi:hypothetical protein
VGKINATLLLVHAIFFVQRKNFLKNSPFEHKFFRKTPFGEPMLE